MKLAEWKRSAIPFLKTIQHGLDDLPLADRLENLIELLAGRPHLLSAQKPCSQLFPHKLVQGIRPAFLNPVGDCRISAFIQHSGILHLSRQKGLQFFLKSSDLLED
ncbi:hypothetical protein SLE2022_102060 [Rubroshorea leprosula]